MIYFKLFLTAVFWGGTFIAGRILAQEVQPWSGSFLRFLVPRCA
jgi:drug/metabolite transporter (DMT)-like permease